MEERNLELDDDGKIKLRKRTEQDAAEELPDEEGDGIVLDVPDFEQFGGEEPTGRDDELVRRSESWEDELRRRKEKAQRIYEEGESLFAAGDYDGAGEKFLDSAAMYAANWRPWFGVVRVQTKEFTDFSGIYDCEQAYDKAFKRMPKAERAELAEKYVPALTARADECAKERERLTAEDVREREDAREEINAAYGAAKKRLFIVLILFGIFLVAGCALAPFVHTVPDVRYLVPCIVCFAAAFVAAVFLIVCLRRFIPAHGARSRNRRAGTTESGERARIFAEEEELIRSVIEDFTK